LTDFDQIWHGGTLSSALLSRLTVKNFKNLKIHDGGDRHLEKSKYRHISAMVEPVAKNLAR